MEQYFVELFMDVSSAEFVESIFKLRVEENEKRIFYCFFTCFRINSTLIKSTSWFLLFPFTVMERFARNL